MTRRGEFELIGDLFAPLSRGTPGAYNLTDDAAVLDAPPGRSVVVTTDAVVAGVHFFPDDPPDLIARKLVRVNLSDLAAMGAVPWGMLLAACIPHGTEDRWLEAFAAGLAADRAEFGVDLIGGDTVATPGPATFSLTAMGLVPTGRALLRGGARAGDLLYASGSIGDATLGLRACRGTLGLGEAAEAFLVDRYRLPRPRVELGRRLVGVATACIDISDGLVQDLGHLCEVSGVGAQIDLGVIPLSAAARLAVAAEPGRIDMVLGGGDDYELLFAADPAAGAEVAAASAGAGVPVTGVGRFVVGAGVRVIGPDGRDRPVVQGGYRHFGTPGSGDGR